MGNMKERNRNMKKSIVLLMGLTLCCSACSSSAEKYPYEHIGIYDVQTEQYIDISDNKASVDKRIGKGVKKGIDTLVEYPDDLTILYDDNAMIEDISIFFPYKSDNLDRYTLPDGTGHSKTVSSFIEKYKYVYEFNEFGNNPDVGIFLKKTKNGNIILSKKDLMSLGNNIEDIYQISISYTSYDDIDHIRIEKFSPRSDDFVENLKEVK